MRQFGRCFCGGCGECDSRYAAARCECCREPALAGELDRHGVCLACREEAAERAAAERAAEQATGAENDNAAAAAVA